nr:retrovirus-related Pol polyprotein from transposon TNT 1-94 [Tanacetum cinerariifolium]
IGNVVGARETVGLTVVQKYGIQSYNCKEFGHVAREYQELEAHYMYMAQLQEVSTDAADSGPIFDAEPLQKVSNNDHYNVFTIESEHAKQSESVHDTYPIEQDEHTVIIDSLDMSYDRERIDQNDDDADLVNESELLASLIEKLKCEIDNSKNRNKFLETSNKVLIEKLKGKQMDESIQWDQKCKSSIELFKIKSSVGTIFDGVERCKETITKRTYFGHIDPFIKNTITQEIRRINAGLEQFHVCLNEEMVADLRYFNSLELEMRLLICNVIIWNCWKNVNVLKMSFQRDLKAQLQDKGIVISELKKLIEKLKGKYVDTKFEKSSVIRQLNAFKSQRPSILGKPTIFSDSLKGKDFSKSKSVIQNNVSNDFSKPVTVQTLPPVKKSILKNTNVLAPGMYKLHTKPTQAKTSQLPQDSRKTNKRVSFSTGVIPTTSVSRPQLNSNPMGDRVMRNNSQGKKQDVEDHRRNVKLSKNKTSVTACNDSLKAKTLNVNFVCATCGKCVLKEKHDMCVLKSRNGVNSRTKMPIDVPVSTREPKRTVKQSVAKPLKKIVALESNQKPRNITRQLYERVSKACSWWYPKFTPSGYKWKPKSEKENVNQNVNMPLRTLVEIVLFIIDFGCSKHMTGNLKLLINFVEKFLGTVKFGNDQIAPILGYGDLNDIVVGLPKLKFIKDHLCSSFARTPKQNGVIERWNRTLVEAARTMLSAAKVPLFFWAEALATACFTQNRSLIIPRHEKTPYHIINDRKSSVKFFHIFGSFCYIIRDGENLDKMKEKGDACIFVGYSTQSRAYRVFNKRTRVIVETIHVNFDELPQMASDHVSSDPAPKCQSMALEHDNLSPGPQCQDNVTQVDRTVTTSNELDLLFSPMFDELLNGFSHVVSKSSFVSTADALNQHQQQHITPLNNQTTTAPTCQVPTQALTVESTENMNQAEMVEEYAQVENDEFINIFCTPIQDRGETSSRHVDSLNMHTFSQHHHSDHRWTNDHPLEQVIGNPSQSIKTRRQLELDGEMCMFALTVSRTEPKNIKEAMADSAWIESMQEALH